MLQIKMLPTFALSLSLMMSAVQGKDDKKADSSCEDGAKALLTFDAPDGVVVRVSEESHWDRHSLGCSWLTAMKPGNSDDIEANQRYKSCGETVVVAATLTEQGSNGVKSFGTTYADSQGAKRHYVD